MGAIEAIDALGLAYRSPAFTKTDLRKFATKGIQMGWLEDIPERW